jgi:hypothetical protein
VGLAHSANHHLEKEGSSYEHVEREGHMGRVKDKALGSPCSGFEAKVDYHSLGWWPGDDRRMDQQHSQDFCP